MPLAGSPDGSLGEREGSGDDEFSSSSRVVDRLPAVQSENSLVSRTISVGISSLENARKIEAAGSSEQTSSINSCIVVCCRKGVRNAWILSFPKIIHDEETKEASLVHSAAPNGLKWKMTELKEIINLIQTNKKKLDQAKEIFCLPIACTSSPNEEKSIFVEYLKNDTKLSCLITELLDNSVLDMLEITLMLKGQQKQLASLSFGLSLMAIMKSNSIAWTRRQIVSSMASFSGLKAPSLEQIDENEEDAFETALQHLTAVSLEKHFNTFVLFNANESVTLSNFAFLWNESEDESRRILEIFKLMGLCQQKSSAYYYDYQPAFSVDQNVHEALARRLDTKGKAKVVLDLVPVRRQQLLELSRQWLVSVLNVDEAEIDFPVLSFLLKTVEHDKLRLGGDILKKFDGRCGCSANTSNGVFLRQMTADQHDYEGRTVAMLLAQCGEVELLEALHKYRPDLSAITKENQNGESALVLAAEAGQVETVKCLCKLHSTSTVKIAAWKALMKASEVGQLAVVKYLAEYDVSLASKQNISGETALMKAAYFGHARVVKFFCQNDRRASRKQNNDGNTALMFAAYNNHLEVVKYLHQLDEQAACQARNNGRNTAMMIAADQGHVDVVRYLAQNDDRAVFQRNSHGNTALMLAAFNGHLNVVQLLADRHKSAILMKDIEGNSALMFSAYYGHLDVVRCLVRNNPSIVQVANNDGETALMLAASNNQVDVVKFLCEQNPGEILRKDIDGWTALMKAASSGHLAVIKELHLRREDVVEDRDNNGNTALMKAAINGHEAVVRFLCENGGDCCLSVQNNDGETALMKAAFYGHFDVVKYLCGRYRCGEVARRDNCGRSAASWAAENRNFDIAGYLADFDVGNWSKEAESDERTKKTSTSDICQCSVM